MTVIWKCKVTLHFPFSPDVPHPQMGERGGGKEAKLSMAYVYKCLLCAFSIEKSIPFIEKNKGRASVLAP